MTVTGRCYCGALRYQATGDPMFKVQCHCRECQYIAGGGPNLTMAMPESGFAYTQGSPRTFRRPDLPEPVAREFCGECGTHILTRAPRVPGAVLLKVGTFDEPTLFGTPQAAIYTVDKQPFHVVAAGVPAFEGVPG